MKTQFAVSSSVSRDSETVLFHIIAFILGHLSSWWRWRGQCLFVTSRELLPGHYMLQRVKTFIVDWIKKTTRACTLFYDQTCSFWFNYGNGKVFFFVSNQIATLNWFWSMQIPMTRTRELLAKETLSCCGLERSGRGWHWGGSWGFIRQCCWEGTLNFDLQWCATDTVSIYILQDYLCIDAGFGKS